MGFGALLAGGAGRVQRRGIAGSCAGRIVKDATACVMGYATSSQGRVGLHAAARRVGQGVLLEPIERSIEHIRATFARIDTRSAVPFMRDGREPPPMPAGDDISKSAS